MAVLETRAGEVFLIDPLLFPDISAGYGNGHLHRWRQQRLRIGNDDDPVFGEFWEEEWLSHPLLQTLLVFSYIYASAEGSARIEDIEGNEDMEALLGSRASRQRQPRAE